MADESKKKKSRWLWPLGVTATGLTGAAVVLLRGCWHSKMSWPVRSHGYSYQVCMGCGIKRLFDEKAFCAYGPYRYDINGLIAWDRAHQARDLSSGRTSRLLTCKAQSLEPASVLRSGPRPWLEFRHGFPRGAVIAGKQSASRLSAGEVTTATRFKAWPMSIWIRLTAASSATWVTPGWRFRPWLPST